jgi:ABC-type transport system involved in multi-copper enzyme maturation permease subunit
MRNFTKILKFETYKIIKNKFLMISSVTFFMIFLSIALGYAYSFPLPQKNELSYEEKEHAVTYYNQQKSFYENILMYLNGETATLPPGVIIASDMDYKQQFEYYDFLLSTGTFESDYLEQNEQGFSVNHRGSYIMVEMLDILSVIMPVIAICLSLYVLRSDCLNGSVKNLIASPIERRNIMFGKSIFLYLLLTVVFTIVILCPMIVGLSDSSAVMLLYGANGYYVQSAFIAIFFPKAISVFFSILFWSGITECFVLIKNRVMSAIYPIMIFAGFRFIYYLIDVLIGVDRSVLFYIFPITFLRYAELYNILNIFQSFTQGWLSLLVAAIFIIAICIISSFICMRRISKQDMRD